MSRREAQKRAGRVRRGFTIVEAVAVMTVVATLASVSSTIIVTAVGSYRDATVKAQLHEEASIAFDRLTRSLWSISRDSSAAVVAPQISSVSATSISYNGNWTLTLSGSQLQLSENGAAAQTLIDSVTSFAISVYDESNAAISLPASGAATQAIRRIQIQVTNSRQGVSETLRTRVFLRCTMSGAKIG
jgi:Tfp pilus assembly protein PilE